MSRRGDVHGCRRDVQRVYYRGIAALLLLLSPALLSDKQKNVWAPIIFALAACLRFCISVGKVCILADVFQTSAQPNAESCSLQQGPFAGQSRRFHYVLLIYHVVGIRLHVPEYFLNLSALPPGLSLCNVRPPLALDTPVRVASLSEQTTEQAKRVVGVLRPAAQDLRVRRRTSFSETA